MRARLFGVLPVYGLLIAFAILLATLLCQRESRRRGLSQDTGLDMILIAIPLAVIGARIYYVLFRWDHYAADPLSALYFWQGGLAIYGGVIGGVLGLFLMSRFKKLSFATLLDIVKALVSAIGTIVLLWGLFEWGTSLQSPNGAEQSSAFKRIGGGLVMILAPQLIALFV